MSHSFSLDFAYTLGRPQSVAAFRALPEDFVVEEELDFEPSGEGEHIVIQLTKTSQNTHWVAQALAKFAQVKTMDVGYCGRKDRHAVTTQWFSLYHPQQTDLNWGHCQIDGVKIHRIDRHSRKLRVGDHSANGFTITLKNLKKTDQLLSRLEAVKCGVPNYFGEQRFGWDGGNLKEGDAWAGKTVRIKNKKQRGLIISALRSYLFNCVLSKRVEEKNWQTILTGDVGIKGVATGPLWGRGRPLVEDQTLAIEAPILKHYSTWCEALEYCGLSQERRPLVCVPEDFDYQFVTTNLDQNSSQLRLRFRLKPGQFATSVLREIAVLDNQSQAVNKRT